MVSLAENGMRKVKIGFNQKSKHHLVYESIYEKSSRSKPPILWFCIGSKFDFWSTFGQQIGKNTPPYPCISLGIPKKKKGFNYLK